jgi:putative transposase
VRPSMRSVDDRFDNAMWESFLATFECELLNRRRFKAQARPAWRCSDFIERRHNSHRRHSALDYPSPINYERSHPAETGFRKPTQSTETE